MAKYFPQGNGICTSEYGLVNGLPVTKLNHREVISSAVTLRQRPKAWRGMVPQEHVRGRDESVSACIVLSGCALKLCGPRPTD